MFSLRLGVDEYRKRKRGFVAEVIGDRKSRGEPLETWFGIGLGFLFKVYGAVSVVFDHFGRDVHGDKFAFQRTGVLPILQVAFFQFVASRLIR